MRSSSLQKLHTKYIKYGWMIGMLIFGVSAVAEAPALSQDFWEYMADFDDGSGGVLDPLEYDQLSNLKNDAAVNVTETNISADSEKKYNPELNNTDMKLNTRSSAQSSSLVMKGATL